MVIQMPETLSVGVVGASGFTGAELLRLLAQHPHLDVAVTTGESSAGRRVADMYPSLIGAYPDLVLEEFDPVALDGLDLVVLGLPHAASMDLAPLLAEAVFGLPELHRDELKGARLVATPGCHVTAAVLALEPLVSAGLVEATGLIVDTMTGVTGAGRTPTSTNIFSSIDSNTVAYGLLQHRHTPEMEQEIGGQILFTPHLVPMSRGLLATCHARATVLAAASTVMEALHDAYDTEPFVTVADAPPATKSVLGSNAVHVSARYDERTGSVIAMCALDNLTKGASGGALHAANIALGIDETAGLSTIGLAP